MIKHKRSQNGFGVVEALCFLVMFSMVGLIGWYVIDQNQTSQETLDNIGGAEVQTKNVDAAKAGEKFVFKEIGVAIMLSDELEGLTYKAEDLGGASPTLYLNSPSLKQIFEKCYGEKVTESPNFGAIGKMTGTYTGQPDEEGWVGPEPLKQFEKFYISGSTPNGTTTCDQPNVDTGLAHSEINKRFRAIGKAFETATLAE